MKKRKKMSKSTVKKIFRYAGFAAVALQVIASVILLVEILRFHILPGKFIFLLFAVLIVAFLPSVFLLIIRKEKKWNIVGFVWVVLLTVIFIFIVSRYIVPARKAMQRFTGQEAVKKIHVEGVSVLVRANDPAQSLSDLNDYEFGIQTAEAYSSMRAAFDYIARSEKLSISLQEFSYYNDVAAALMSGKISAMIANTSYVPLLEEYVEGFVGNYRVLSELTFDAEILEDISQYNLTATPTLPPLPTEDITGTPTVTVDPDAPTEEVTPTPTSGIPTPVIPFTAMPSRSSSTDVTKNYFTVYVSGIDCYGGITAQSRSDVNIIMVVNPNTKKILLVTTPRDSYVLIPGVTGANYDKLTHAGIYGVKASMETLEQVYGIKLDYYLRVNFSSVERIVDYLGGVDVYNPIAFNACRDDLSYPQGMVHMSGHSALVYARERYAFEAGDYQRGRNQMQLIKGILNKVQTPWVLNSFANIMEAISANLQTSLTDDQLTSLVRMQLDSGASWTVDSYDVQTTGDYAYCFSYQGAKLYVGRINWDSAKEAARRMRAVMAGE